MAIEDDYPEPTRAELLAMRGAGIRRLAGAIARERGIEPPLGTADQIACFHEGERRLFDFDLAIERTGSVTVPANEVEEALLMLWRVDDELREHDGDGVDVRIKADSALAERLRRRLG